ncbi:MAG: ABC transporter permease [Nanoarchaeota archaeon]|nr:ABC transporter permease [Nanoarchaeota archaeon]
MITQVSEYSKIAIKSLRNRKLRSWLTILGIVIGVAAIISLIAISSGLKNSISEQFSKMGSSRIFIFPKSAAGTGDPSSATGLTKDDFEAIEKLSYFEFVTPYLMAEESIEFKRENVKIFLRGIPSDNIEERFEDFDITLEKGRYFNPNEKRVVVLGSRAAKNVFSNEIKVKNNIIIDNENYEVVGIMNPVGAKDDDEAIYIPIETVRELSGKENQVTMMEAKLKPGQDPELVAARVKQILKKERGDEQFEIMTAEQLLRQVDSILGVVQAVLVGIATISLIVGAIGIMNSMYTSVLERRKEIGIMKSIGAQNRDILFIFLIEAGIMGMIGGLIGIGLGAGLAFLIEGIGKQAGFPLLVRIPWWLITSGMLFALVIGMLSGLLPAKNATEMNVVDALREN